MSSSKPSDERAAPPLSNPQPPQPTSADLAGSVPSAAPAEARSESEAPGTVRIAADFGFETVVDGTRYTEAQARRGISLPPGSHTAQLTCLNCPEGVRQLLEVGFVVTSGQVTRRPVRFGQETNEED